MRPHMSYEEHKKHMASLGKEKSPISKRPGENREYAEYKKLLDSKRGSLAPKHKALSIVKK